MTSPRDLLAAAINSALRWEGEGVAPPVVDDILATPSGALLLARIGEYADHRERCHNYDPDSIIAFLHTRIGEAEALWESARQAIAPDQRLVVWADGGREGSSVPGLTWGQVTAPEGEDMVPIRTKMGKTFIEALQALAAPDAGPQG